ncbi:MAG: cytochrome c biogenesis protein CcsA [Anaerolineales bacterium]|nr:cytochrome c biogenesis protein CcsA [Anaerolineales bacterium]
MRVPAWTWPLTWAAALAVGIAFLAALAYAPREEVMGDVQRIFYFHVSTGWVGGLGFMVAAVCGGLYLRRPSDNLDDIGHAAVEIGLVFTVINIITGSIWARPVWNTWWTWDPRLITASIMAVVYAGYLALRFSIELPESRGRMSAGYAILGFVSVPMTFFSIRLFRTIHPVVVGTGAAAAESIGMSGRMAGTLMLSLAAFTLLFAALLTHRLRLSRLQRLVEHRSWEQLGSQ